MCIYEIQVEKFHGERNSSFIKCFLSAIFIFFSFSVWLLHEVHTRGNKTDFDCFFSAAYIHHSIKLVYVADEFYDGRKWNAFNYI